MSKGSPTRLRRAGTWLLLGIPSAFVFFSTVKVEDARTNLAGWLTFAGINRVPAFIETVTADLSVLLFSLASLGFTAWSEWRDTKEEFGSDRKPRRRPNSENPEA